MYRDDPELSKSIIENIQNTTKANNSAIVSFPVLKKYIFFD
jgi:hypothetical protein